MSEQPVLLRDAPHQAVRTKPNMAERREKMRAKRAAARETPREAPKATASGRAGTGSSNILRRLSSLRDNLRRTQSAPAKGFGDTTRGSFTRGLGSSKHKLSQGLRRLSSLRETVSTRRTETSKGPDGRATRKTTSAAAPRRKTGAAGRGAARRVSATDWKLNTPIYRLYAGYYQRFKERELRTEAGSRVFRIEGGSCCLSVVLMEDENHVVLATAGLSNLGLLQQASRGIAPSRRLCGHELVLQLRREHAVDGPTPHPEWAIELLRSLMLQRLQGTASPLRAGDDVTVPPTSAAPYTKFVAREPRPYSPWAVALDDAHGQVSFLELAPDSTPVI